jgi:hypothetical protein
MILLIFIGLLLIILIVLWREDSDFNTLFWACFGQAEGKYQHTICLFQELGDGFVVFILEII